MSLPDLPKACGCVSPHAGARPDSEQRRKVIKIAVAGMAVPWVVAGGLAHAAITRGDCLVDDDAEGTPVPLKASDLRAGKPVVAYPFDAKQGIVRKESRLNRIVLLKLAEADMDATTKARAAGGEGQDHGRLLRRRNRRARIHCRLRRGNRCSSGLTGSPATAHE